ncbi:MAG: DNA primase, partial [Clostridiales bacterium]|nr:DNA primase [Clostridiales bacterium]
ILKSAGISVRVLNMKPYKDPDEFISHEGAEAFQKRIDEAINSFLFECDVLRMKYEHEWDNPEKKTEFHREVAGKLTEFPDELERNNYLEAVCFRYQIPADSLRDMVRRIGARRPVSVSSEASEDDYGENGNFVKMRQKKKRDKEEGLLEAQRLLLNWGFSDNDHPDFLMKYLDPEDFSHELFHDLAETAWAAWKQGKRPEAAAVINRYMEDEEKRSETAAVFNTVLPEGLTSAEEERILTESVRRLRKASLDAAARKETDPRKLQDIILEKAKWETLHISL